MSLDKTIRENLNGKYLTIHANYFQEGVEYASAIGISQIQLRGILGQENSDMKVDFKEFEKISKNLEIIVFSGVIENIINFESFYCLNNLKKISFQHKQKFQLDISKFPKIQHLGSEYWKGLQNIDKAISLTNIVLSKLPDNNLKRFSKLQNLKILHIYSSKIQTLEGIEKLKIEEISLARNNDLEDISVIEKIKTLRELNIEKCKKIITDNTFINSLKEKINVTVIK